MCNQLPFGKWIFGRWRQVEIIVHCSASHPMANSIPNSFVSSHLMVILQALQASLGLVLLTVQPTTNASNELSKYPYPNNHSKLYCSTEFFINCNFFTKDLFKIQFWTRVYPFNFIGIWYEQFILFFAQTSARDNTRKIKSHQWVRQNTDTFY